jgi:hypothetical protein
LFSYRASLSDNSSFLKEHKAFVAAQHNVERLQATVAQQQEQIEAVTAVVQKVSAQVELSKRAPQTVSNDCKKSSR